MKADTLLTLAAALHAANDGPDAWDAAMAVVALGLGAAGVSLLAQNKETGSTIDLIVAGDIARDPGDMMRYKQHFAPLDPGPWLINRVPLGEVVQCHNWLPAEMVRRSEYHNDFLLPFGGRYLAGMNILDTGLLRASMAVHTSLRTGPLKPEAVQAMKRLLPHFQTAYRARVALAHESVRAAALDQLNDGIAVVTVHGEVVFANAAAAQWVEGGRLHFSPARPAQPGEHSLVLATLEQASSGRGDELLRLDALPDRPALLLNATRLPLQSKYSLAVPLCAGPLILLKIQRAGAAALAGVALLARRFELTPAETEVAELAISGATTASIASKRKVSPATVRMQIRHVLGKTGVPSLRVLAAVAAGIDIQNS